MYRLYGKCTAFAAKTADVAQLQDELTGALIGLAQTQRTMPTTVNDGTWRLMMEGLFTTLTNVSFNEKTIARDD